MWIILVVVVVAFLIFVLYRALKEDERQDEHSSPENTRPPGHATQPTVRGHEYLPSTAVLRHPGRLSATEMLSCLDELQQVGAQWSVIWTRLNPHADAEVQRLLVEIRGPHMFAPHLALGAIEVGCRRALAQSPDADALAALQLATHDDRFWR